MKVNFCGVLQEEFNTRKLKNKIKQDAVDILREQNFVCLSPRSTSKIFHDSEMKKILIFFLLFDIFNL